ncbi:hypothetical protein [Bosea sp. TND4EK4]|uniref:hypothetical protein n=1 Tax=Bosea sp. TND4EK4 TaxID=1907408 RepID=UPI0011154CE6|nr:hypothetical protein [Bosea sp. TND4EK4]
MFRVSENAKACLRAGVARFGPASSRAWAAFRAGLARAGRIDAVPALIAAADAIEFAAGKIWQALRWLAPSRGMGLTGALLWRSAAALAGIGFAATLVTGLSARDDSKSRLAALAMPDAGRSTAAAEQTVPSHLSWIPVTRPIAMFNLDAPELGRASPSLAARSSDGAREDLLSYGSLAEPKPHLLLALRTGDMAAAPARSFTVALAREAAELALSVTRSSAPVPVETRFGLLETADVELGDGQASRSCIAFRSTSGVAGFALRGWWCAAGKPSDRRQLTCLIERLDLVNAAGDQQLRAAFAASELRRTGSCERAHLASSGRKASWLDAEAAAPALKVKKAEPEPAKALPRPRKKPAKLSGRRTVPGPAET